MTVVPPFPIGHRLGLSLIFLLLFKHHHDAPHLLLLSDSTGPHWCFGNRGCHHRHAPPSRPRTRTSASDPIPPLIKLRPSSQMFLSTSSTAPLLEICLHYAGTVAPPSVLPRSFSRASPPPFIDPMACACPSGGRAPILCHWRPPMTGNDRCPIPHRRRPDELGRGPH